MKKRFILKAKQLPYEEVEGEGADTQWMALCPFHNDSNPSLSINPKSEMFNCFGCPASGKAWEVIDIFDYTDETGQLRYQEVKLRDGTAPTGKTFRQRRPDGQGGWDWNMEGVERLLYNLPAVLKAESVFIVEGAKDVKSLFNHGAQTKTAATTASGGAKVRWDPRFNEWLKGKHIVVIPDNDEVGRKHGLDILHNLKPVAKSLRQIFLTNEKDITEWFEAGHKIEELIEWIKRTEEWIPSESTPSQEVEGREDEEIKQLLNMLLKDLNEEEKNALIAKDFSDTENARRFMRLMGGRKDFLWIEDMKEWWCFNPYRPGWGDGEIPLQSYMQTMTDLVRELILQAPQMDEKLRIERLKQIIAWKDAPGITRSIQMLRSETFGRSTEFDVDPFLFLCKTGVIDLKTGEIRSAQASDLLRKISPVEFDPEAQCPKWIQFLEEIFPDREGRPDKDLIRFIQKFAGYTMTGNTKEEKFLILEGSGANGKSTFLEVLAKVMGDYAKPIPFATFKDPKWDQAGNVHQADICGMIGARFIRSIEVKEHARLNIERLKSLTGNDKMSARFPYARHATEFYPVCKIWLAVNHLPRIHDTTLSAWRRLLRVMFLYTVPEERRIKDLARILFESEGSGILNWMLEGCEVWLKEGIEPIPQSVLEATDEYQTESTPIRQFINMECDVDKKYHVRFPDLYRTLIGWWKEEYGETFLPSKTEVGKELKRMGFRQRDVKKIRNYIGLRLKNED